MGRHAKPLVLHQANGNASHLTHAEIEQRASSEISIGNSALIMPKHLKINKAAVKKWRDLINLYAGADIATSADVEAMAEYCEVWSQYIDLVERRREIAHIEPFDDEEQSEIDTEFVRRRGTRAAKKMWDKVEFIMSTGGIIALDKAINSKVQTMTALSDRLFLNPLARVKNVLKQPKEPKADPLASAGFGGI